MIEENVYYEYTCKCCGYFWKSKEKLLIPNCPKCIGSGVPYTIPYTPIPLLPEEDVFDPCLHCSGDPRNGGSGNCNCMLPFLFGKFKVT